MHAPPLLRQDGSRLYKAATIASVRTFRTSARLWSFGLVPSLFALPILNLTISKTPQKHKIIENQCQARWTCQLAWCCQFKQISCRNRWDLCMGFRQSRTKSRNKRKQETREKTTVAETHYLGQVIRECSANEWDNGKEKMIIKLLQVQPQWTTRSEFRSFMVARTFERPLTLRSPKVCGQFSCMENASCLTWFCRSASKQNQLATADSAFLHLCSRSGNQESNWTYCKISLALASMLWHRHQEWL